MKNPFDSILTKDEQKIFGFLGALMIVGMCLYYSGVSNMYASKHETGTAELNRAVEKDSLVQIDIRTADLEALVRLPGIGEKRAQDIISYRLAKQFESTEELLNIKGIGAKTFLNMKPSLMQFGVTGRGVENPDKLNEVNAGESVSTEHSTPGDKQPLDETGDVANKEQSSGKQASNQVSSTIRLNSATKDDLMSLEGIGEVKAGLIIDYRKKIGGFTSIEQLLDVKGIGPKTLDKNRHRLSL